MCHLAVEPGAEAFARVSSACDPGTAEVQMRVPDFGDHYRFRLDQPPDRHPLLEAALKRWAPQDRSLEVDVRSAVPAGSSLGTSASVLVALIAALQQLRGPSPSDGPGPLAHAAHDIEAVDLGRQSGIQDQAAAAFGGANLVTISPYPSFEVKRLDLQPSVWAALADRVLTIYLGAFHDSSVIHGTVIEHLAGDDNEADRLLSPLRASAARAAEALLAGDLGAYGEAMIANTEAQACLHPTLVNPVARRVIEISEKCGAIGWKVNGAGGDGGTVTVVTAEDRDELVRALEEVPGLEVLALNPTPWGARVVDQG